MSTESTWDEVFGDLDVRTLDDHGRLALVHSRIESVLGDRSWTSYVAGEEGQLAWDAAVRTFVGGIWVACIFSCHVVCEREVAGVLSVSTARLNGDLPKGWAGFGLGRLLSLAHEHDLLPPRLITNLRALADARKPYGHWRSEIHPESLLQRVQAEYEATGQQDWANLRERLVVRDATSAMLTSIELYFGNYGLGGP